MFQTIGQLTLKLMVFAGQWLLFHWVLNLTPFPQMNQGTSLLSLIIVTFAALFSTVIVFHNR
ncbi:hypothetical protein E4665_10575 [Sporolactobacillus shoreae]|uniref:Uncharacterized protein n=1 Tax=Sporolactobacillus shoreae TaxID=1465501 RepID=A0A4Z0GND6_9BACL|nr:hypothetical protein [Sporolactobacillus shoreae]TGA97834.1 hypothetical protein E4665_10575 [Sporolactobacillus shoreae]